MYCFVNASRIIAGTRELYKILKRPKIVCLCSISLTAHRMFGFFNICLLDSSYFSFFSVEICFKIVQQMFCKFQRKSKLSLTVVIHLCLEKH